MVMAFDSIKSTSFCWKSEEMRGREANEGRNFFLRMFTWSPEICVKDFLLSTWYLCFVVLFWPVIELKVEVNAYSIFYTHESHRLHLLSVQSHTVYYKSNPLALSLLIANRKTHFYYENSQTFSSFHQQKVDNNRGKFSIRLLCPFKLLSNENESEIFWY